MEHQKHNLCFVFTQCFVVKNESRLEKEAHRPQLPHQSEIAIAYIYANFIYAHFSIPVIATNERIVILSSSWF